MKSLLSLSSSRIVPLLLWSSSVVVVVVRGQKVENDNYEIIQEELSNEFRIQNQQVQTHYMCTFRGLWTRQRHPVEFPALGRWSAPIVFSHSLQYIPWQVGERVTVGIEKIAESGFWDLFEQELKQSGEQTLDFAGYPEFGWFVGDRDFVHIPPVEVNFEFPYLTSAAGLDPSPDWFTGFNRYFTVDEYERKYWERFIIMTYPFDAGTDSGEDYEATPDDIDPAIPVERITIDNAPHGIFVSPDATTVLPVAEWDCSLKITALGEQVVDDRPDCDVLKYPNCNATDCIDGNNGKGCKACDPDLPSCQLDGGPTVSSAASLVGAASMTAFLLLLTGLLQRILY